MMLEKDNNDYSNKNCITLLTELKKSVNSFSNVNMVYQESNVFTHDECDEIINIGYTNKLGKQKTEKIVVDLNSFNSNISYILPNSKTNYIYNRLRKLVVKLNNKYWHFNLIDFGEPLKFIEYDSKDFGNCTIHSDISNSEINFRKLTIVIQLSDETYYEGGDLVIYNDKNTTTFNKQRGSIIIFPSFMLHKVKPVTQGKRNSLVIFAHGPQLC